MANESRKISQAKKEMYIAVNAMREDVSKMASKHFDDSFKNEGFTYNSLFKWKPRKRADRQRPGRPILQDSGRLRKSIKSNVFTTKDYFEVRFRSNVPYAAIHNDGLRGIAFGKYPFKMPKRQFIGYSPALNKRLSDKFNKRIKNIFRP